MRRLRRWCRLRMWRWQTAVAVGVLFMGVSGVINVVIVGADEANEHANDAVHRRQIAELQAELECRSVIGAEASNIQGEIGQATALGLVAVARGDEAALAVQADRIEALALELGPALERRAAAVEECASPGGTP